MKKAAFWLFTVIVFLTLFLAATAYGLAVPDRKPLYRYLHGSNLRTNCLGGHNDEFVFVAGSTLAGFSAVQSTFGMTGAATAQFGRILDLAGERRQQPLLHAAAHKGRPTEGVRPDASKYGQISPLGRRF